ncbi:neutral ceramidase isoform 1 [Danaus plexippus plexippus]|uniref:Neutral ceramidase n=1 Tax=Danaus plexippus plexippus TaxID=278856 RepID=A0A212EIG5_DANPL|nr:neutral ceramidase isoform 1 [Danaus plexippus plexippus]
MAISLTGKLVITFVALAVAAGMTTMIVFLLKEEDSETPVTTTPTPGPEPVQEYQVGVGIADITGPCAEITFMGYAEMGQKGGGIHLRQFSRAFIFVRGDTRVVLVTADVAALGIAVRREVVRKLQQQYGNLYDIRNVILTGTHTHSGPGGYLVDFLFDITILGFSKETFDAYVDGITRSIVNAHNQIVPARLFVSSTHVLNAQMNRSPFSYDQNPAEERQRYNSNTDTELTQLRVVKADGSLYGVLNWFAVHTTSMNMTNRLISSDNLGYAAMRMEKELNPGRAAGKPKVVAGFFSSNLGDISPNIRGPRCERSGQECDNQFQICDLFELCFAQGPGEDMFESTKKIGEAVFQGAMEALNKQGEELNGSLRVMHQFLEMPLETGRKYDPVARNFTNERVRGCVPGLGYSFASGTFDGANILNITQGTLTNNPLLDAIASVVARPTSDDVACHAPKPILLATGRANFPVPWHPRTVSLSLITIGSFAVVGYPGEPTTMAGRRMKDVVGDALRENGFEPKVVISGLTNEYTHYVATFEEYQVQRYEAASTIYGPHTLDIILSKLRDYTIAAVTGAVIAPGPEPQDYVNRTISLIPSINIDTTPVGANFGDVIQQPPEVVRPGDTVRAQFVGANPRNDLRQESSYVAVERLELGHWTTVATDADWETRFYWERVGGQSSGESRVTVMWTSSEASNLPHRLTYYGAARGEGDIITPFTGVSNSFMIRAVTKDNLLYS